MPEFLSDPICTPSRASVFKSKHSNIPGEAFSQPPLYKPMGKPPNLYPDALTRSSAVSNDSKAPEKPPRLDEPSSPSLISLAGSVANFIPGKRGTTLGLATTLADIPNNDLAGNLMNVGWTGVGMLGRSGAGLAMAKSGFDLVLNAPSSPSGLTYSNAIDALENNTPRSLYGRYATYVRPGLSPLGDHLKIQPDHPEYQAAQKALNDGNDIWEKRQTLPSKPAPIGQKPSDWPNTLTGMP